MRDLELSRNISVGQYVDRASALHALGAGTKYLLLLALSIPALVSPTPVGALLPLAAALVAARFAGIGAAFLLRGLRLALPFFGLAALFQFAFAWPGDASPLLFALGPLEATARELWVALLVVARGASMIAAVSLFTSIAREEEILRGVEEGLRPLARLGLPAHRLSLAVGAALRFVPIVAEELEAIAKAQACRGADFGSGRKGPLARARAWLPLFVPVTVRALERAELLAEAMEARCYTGLGRARSRRPATPPLEWLFRALALLLAASCIVLDTLIIEVRIRPW